MRPKNSGIDVLQSADLHLLPAVDSDTESETYFRTRNQYCEKLGLPCRMHLSLSETGSLQYRWAKRHPHATIASNSGGALFDEEQLPGNKRRCICRIESPAKTNDGW